MRDLGNNNFLKKDTALTIKRYPKLSAHVSLDGTNILEGEIDLTDDNNVGIELFKVKLLYTNKFPFAYPKVCETGGRFPKNDERMHINGDGTLCLNTEPLEAIDTFHGMSTINFIEKILLPNLAWRICKLEKMDDGLKDFSHGTRGTLEAYMELLEITEPGLVLTYLSKYLENALPKRNDPCLCGIPRKFKRCHESYKSKLAHIPNNIILKHVTALKTYISENKL
jgi:hypothetical protein